MLWSAKNGLEFEQTKTYDNQTRRTKTCTFDKSHRPFYALNNAVKFQPLHREINIIIKIPYVEECMENMHDANSHVTKDSITKVI